MKLYQKVIIPLLLLAACTTIANKKYVKDGKTYGEIDGIFRGKWYQHYERGVSFAEGGFFKEASESFKRAIRRRQDDGFRHRTYGLHYIAYFPHRELGIIYYKLGYFDKALGELRESLKTANSAKSLFYFNRINQDILVLTGEDKRAPQISINFPKNFPFTKNRKFTVSGTCEDDYLLSEIFVNGKAINIEKAKKKASFRRVVELRRGENKVEIKALDLSGKTKINNIVVKADWDGPVVGFNSFKLVANGSAAELEGYLVDFSGISEFKINGKKIALVNNKKFSCTVRLLDKKIAFSAKDNVGNTTVGRIDIPDNIASLLPSIASSSAKIKVPSSIKILVKGINSRQATYQDALKINIAISSYLAIKEVFINEQEMKVGPGKIVSLSHTLLFPKIRQYKVKIAVVDVAGNRQVFPFNIQRKENPLGNIKTSLAIFPFKSGGRFFSLEEKIFNGLNRVFQENGRFRLVERKEIDKILLTKKLNKSLISEPLINKELNKIIPAEMLLLGTYYEEKDAIEVEGRVVDSETSAILLTKRVYSNNKSATGINKALKRLGEEIRNAFPIVDGTVREKVSTEVFIDAGKEEHIIPGCRFIAYKKGRKITDADGVAILGYTIETLGEIKITKVRNNFSRGEIIITPKKPNSRINKGNLVISK